MAILQFPLRVELELEFLREDAAGFAVEFEACIVLPALVVAEDVPDCVVVDREIAESAVVGLFGFNTIFKEPGCDVVLAFLGNLDSGIDH